MTDCHRNDDLCKGESCWVCWTGTEPNAPIDPDDNPDSDERPDYDY